VVANDVRVTVNQGLQLRFIKPEHLPYIYSVLEEAGFSAAGAGSLADITACPGTDTCNLGISNSTGTALVLAETIENEYPEFLEEKDMTIRISGCMNSCGQHGMASIGFHGSSLKVKGSVVPALQVLIGGAVLGSGEARISDKVIKVPSRRAPDALRIILNDFKQHANGLTFAAYSAAKGSRYYYELLKTVADVTTIQDEEFIDWGQSEKFATAIGVGECAGVMIDLVTTLLLEAEEKLAHSAACLSNQAFADAIYHAYSAQVHAAKAVLLQHGVQCNTQNGILTDFDATFTRTGLYTRFDSFRDSVIRMNEVEPSGDFAKEYLQQALEVVKDLSAFRKKN
jgi:sulfite reductase (ferredoxin)